MGFVPEAFEDHRAQQSARSVAGGDAVDSGGGRKVGVREPRCGRE